LPINPKTKIKIRGKKILNTTAEGLRSMALKLALVMASIALNWLYDEGILENCPANVAVNG
jgi:hypothetical protein